MPTLTATDRLYAEYVNPQWVRLLDALQMNVPYVRCEGAELFRADGQRVLDFLSGYRVHNTGHNHGLTRKDIGRWILHTGGPKILEATAKALELPKEALDASWECLRRVGNLSSTSVLLVLEELMKQRRPAAGRYSLLAAMGPAFCSELVLLRWN